MQQQQTPSLQHSSSGSTLSSQTIPQIQYKVEDLKTHGLNFSQYSNEGLDCIIDGKFCVFSAKHLPIVQERDNTCLAFEQYINDKQIDIRSVLTVGVNSMNATQTIPSKDDCLNDNQVSYYKKKLGNRLCGIECMNFNGGIPNMTKFIHLLIDYFPKFMEKALEGKPEFFVTLEKIMNKDEEHTEIPEFNDIIEKYEKKTLEPIQKLKAPDEEVIPPTTEIRNEESNAPLSQQTVIVVGNEETNDVENEENNTFTEFRDGTRHYNNRNRTQTKRKNTVQNSEMKTAQAYKPNKIGKINVEEDESPLSKEKGGGLKRRVYIDDDSDDDKAKNCIVGLELL